MQDWLGLQNTHTAEESWRMNHEIAAGYGKVEYIHGHMVAIIPHPPSSVNLASFRSPQSRTIHAASCLSSLCFSVGWRNLHLHDNPNDSRQWLNDEKVISLGSRGWTASSLLLGLGGVGTSDQPTTGQRHHRRSKVDIGIRQDGEGLGGERQPN